MRVLALAAARRCGVNASLLILVHVYGKYFQPCSFTVSLGKLIALVAAASCVATCEARSQALDVAPVSLTLVAGQRTASINITNRGDQKTSIQTRPFAWAGADRSDQLSATKDIAVSPPLFELGPGETQLVRLVVRAPAVGSETTYRLLLDQVPGPAAAGTIRVALRISLPVFVRPAGLAAPVLAWSLERKGADLELVCRNSGARHAHITQIKLDGVPAGVGLDQQSPAYVLARAQQHWRMKDPARSLTTGAVVRISADTDEGRVDATAAVSETP